jgi:hypothetical protein
VHIASRIFISLLVTLLTLVLASTALAGGRRGHPAHHPDLKPPATDHRPEAGHPERGPGEELSGGPRAGEDRRGRRGCRRGLRPGPNRRCDYYYDEDGKELPAADSGDAAQPQAARGPAKIAPPPRQDGDIESFTPHADKQLKQKLIAARKNWLKEKSHLDDANTARAKAEYQATQTGSSVDPAIIARQQEARKEAAAAHAALSPLIEQGREAGIAPEVLDLYERANSPD